MSEKSKKIIWVIIGGIVLITVAYTAYNFKLIKACYYDAKRNDFTIGDKLYPPNYFITDKPNDIFLYRLIRPMTGAEIDAMDVEEWKKPLMKQNLKPSDDLKVILSNKRIMADSLIKYKAWNIGNYLGKEYIYIKNNAMDGYLPYYAIKPNWSLINTDPTEQYLLPGGYTYANNNLYVLFTFAKTKEKFENK